MNNDNQEKYDKDFNNWHNLKSNIQKRNAARVFIQQGAVWLMSVGVNVGSEIDGKGRDFARPVIVIRRINNETFYGISVSSRIVEDFYRVKFNMADQGRIALLSQIRSFDKKRCIRLITILPPETIELILARVRKVFTKAETPQPQNATEGNLDCPKGDSDTSLPKH